MWEFLIFPKYIVINVNVLFDTMLVIVDFVTQTDSQPEFGC